MNSYLRIALSSVIFLAAACGGDTSAPVDLPSDPGDGDPEASSDDGPDDPPADAPAEPGGDPGPGRAPEPQAPEPEPEPEPMPEWSERLADVEVKNSPGEVALVATDGERAIGMFRLALLDDVLWLEAAFDDNEYCSLTLDAETLDAVIEHDSSLVGAAIAGRAGMVRELLVEQGKGRCERSSARIFDRCARAMIGGNDALLDCPAAATELVCDCLAEPAQRAAMPVCSR